VGGGGGVGLGVGFVVWVCFLFVVGGFARLGAPPEHTAETLCLATTEHRAGNVNLYQFRGQGGRAG